LLLCPLPLRLFLHSPGDPRDLLSFPTRRSSDLGGPAAAGGVRRSPARSLRGPVSVPGPLSPCPRRPACLADLRESSNPLVPTLRSEEHTSELQSLTNLVCRLLLEKKNKTSNTAS